MNILFFFKLMPVIFYIQTKCIKGFLLKVDILVIDFFIVQYFIIENIYTFYILPPVILIQSEHAGPEMKPI